jgi:hypothetical protein
MSVAALTVQKRPWCDEMQMDYSPTCRGQQKRLCFGMASPQVHQQQAPASPLFHKEPARQTYSNPNSPFNRSIPHGTHRLLLLISRKLLFSVDHVDW